MQIMVNNQERVLGDRAFKKTESRLAASFAKFGRSVLSIELFVEDVNGPCCGLDKECRLIVRLNKMKDVVVTARDAKISQAISNAINRAERTVARAIQRCSGRDADRDSNFNVSIFGQRS